MAEFLGSTEQVGDMLMGARKLAAELQHQFVMPEHMLRVMIELPEVKDALTICSVQPHEIPDALDKFFSQQDQVPVPESEYPGMSEQGAQLMHLAFVDAYNSESAHLTIAHYIDALLKMEESWAAYILRKAINDDTAGFMACLLDEYRDEDFPTPGQGDDYEPFDDPCVDEQPADWHAWVTCINDDVANHNPLIGRQAELERTIQVLCRKDKNNPLHVGEPGVGKTSLVYGLADRINKGEVPERISHCRIYSMDMGTMLAGTQYRGDFEQRIKKVMDGARKEGNVIIYMDEMHNIVGAGRSSDGSIDASNMLKPYLESGDIRFIGSTTYDELKRWLSASMGILRRFQEIDIKEPSVDETIEILQGLEKGYEDYHHVRYTGEAIEEAVRASAKYIADRFLPDKAIDLIDEAGAYRELHPSADDEQTVDKDLVRQVLAKICKIDATVLKDSDNHALQTLYDRIAAKIYGQDEAVRQVVESVEMAKAGLQEEGKPLASLLFVGPTGVGKTEVARVLANELGVSLVRFDMSEYTEKQTVAKLIGSPAGYVGYEDGGLLTDAIRKTPNCVLLLDEIEKAHSDIYNILLQVMDYAVLTDNKGRKADFRNVVLIMTSNAGARFASQASVGFNGHTSRGEAMLAQVKRTFTPEFINRLSATVVFHDMDEQMARLILKKKLDILQAQLVKKGVTMQLSDAAAALLLKKGFTTEYGAREMDRVIARELKPLLMRGILFGELAHGGIAKIEVRDGGLAIG
ncbi:MAG: AAA family ATPase [Prevotella sp.]|nr:AAA family ATPase [Prevotella sp.]